MLSFIVMVISWTCVGLIGMIDKSRMDLVSKLNRCIMDGWKAFSFYIQCLKFLIPLNCP